MQCDRPLSAIVLGFTVRLAHSLQDGDDRPMQHDRLLSAIVSLSRSDRPIPSRMATNVLCSAIGPSAPSYLASRFGSPIPFRMATTVLCSTIGFSAPSCLFHVQLVHPFQGGHERLMQYDRTLSAIVPSSRSARPSLPGWPRTSYASRSASAPSCLAHVRVAHPFQDGDERLYAARSAPQRHRVWLTLGSPVPFRMATNVSYAARSAPQRHRVRLTLGSPIPFRMATNVSYAARSALQRHRVRLTLGSPIPFRMATNVSYAARSALQRHRVWLTLGSPIPFKMATNVSYAARLHLGVDMPGLSMRATTFYHISHSFSHTLHPYITCIHAFMHHTSYIHTYARAS
ncbi:unnamed protein product [Cuscuta epithymum]|uniref:Uncharacterized protein n=1 Tax=Cuscuta epithymum TaxID=186058 RepID=A0AAV0C7Q4_9ASTE|nr:unnamed protein product [Cuscuta epithymum]